MHSSGLGIYIQNKGELQGDPMSEVFQSSLWELKSLKQFQPFFVCVSSMVITCC